MPDLKGMQDIRFFTLIFITLSPLHYLRSIPIQSGEHSHEREDPSLCPCRCRGKFLQYLFRFKSVYS